MDIYHIWCNLKEGVRDADFVERCKAYFAHLEEEQVLSGHRIMRRKLGLGPPHLHEFHIMLEFDDLTHLDRAFSHVASRAEPVEGFHHCVNSLVSDVTFALYRDFPDPVRQTGEERF